MPKTTLQEKINKFNNTYGATLDLTALERHANQFKYLDNFLFEKKNDNPELTAYLRGLNKALLDCIKDKLQMNENGNYDLSNFQIPEFIQDYEEIMAQKNEEAENSRNRAPFEGAKFKDVVKMAGNALGKYNKALSNVWADSILNGEFSVAQMQIMTNTSHLHLYNAMQPENERRGKKEDGTWTDEVKGSLRNLIAAKQAMENVRQQRGIFFKIFSFRKNAAEKEYLASLTMLVEGYRAVGYPVEEVMSEVSASALKGAYENAKGYKAREANRQAQKSVVSTKAAAVIADAKFQETFKKEIKNSLPAAKFDDLSVDMLVSSMVVESLVKTVQRLNEKFDQAVYEGADSKKEMVNIVKNVAKEAFRCASSLGYTAPQEQLLVGQIITDVVLKKVSPAAFDKENYAEFANGYILNNPDVFDDELRDQDIYQEQYVEGAKNAYNEKQNCRENIQVNEANVAVQANEVAPVEQVPAINAPSINKN